VKITSSTAIPDLVKFDTGNLWTLLKVGDTSLVSGRMSDTPREGRVHRHLRKTWSAYAQETDVGNAKQSYGCEAWCIMAATDLG
jgi:hypothetical protein